MALAQLINEGKYGETARSVNELIDKLTTINWYSKAGQTNPDVEGNLARFMSAVAETIEKLSFENSELWEVLKELPDEFRKKIDSLGNQQLLNDVVDKVPEAVFHGAYKHACEAFTEEKTIKFLIGHAMYISTLACTAELADEKDKMSILLDLLEDGHLPLGPNGNTFYLL
jgi:NADH dehydrogenase/NADH:ubiquinone oxidoreductase subunit G